MELKLDNNKPKSGLNISSKEKSLLLLLAAVIMLFLFYKYIMTPQEAAIITLRAEKAGSETELLKLQQTLAKEKILNTEYESLKEEYKKATGKYYSEVDQPELMHMINGVLDNSKLEIPSITFDEPETVKVEGVDAKLAGVSIAYRGSFSQLEDMLSQFRSNPKKLLVKQLSLDREDADTLNGQLSLNSIALNSGVALKDGYFYTNGYSTEGKTNPFEAFKGYVEVAVDPDGSGEEKRALLSDLESDAIYFMASSSEVTGKVDRVGGGKFGRTAIRAEYYISTGYQPERAYLVLDDQNISMKYPPPSVGVWAYSYGYSPATVGMRFQTLDGEKIDIKLSEGVNWIGWKYISAPPPQDVKLYPIKLDRLYMELGPNKDDYGVLLFDRLEASYPGEGEEAAAPASYDFYVVQPGDTLMDISYRFYGTKYKYTSIMKDNGLASGEQLEAGKVLVIRK